MSNYTQLGFVKQTDGENTGTWGDVLNENLIDLLDDAIGGYVEVSVASGNVTLAFADGTADNNGRHAVIKFTGSPGTTRTVTFPDKQINYFIVNGSDSSVICTSGTGAATVTIPTGLKDVIYIDGSDEVYSMFSTPHLSSSGNFTVDATTDIILDADGGDIFFKDGGTTFGSATNTSGNLIIKSGTTTALTFSGANVTVAGDLTVSGDDITMGTNTAGNVLVADGTNFNSVAVGDLSEISTVASDDVIMAVDTSGGGLKKITRANLVSGLAAGTMSNVVDDTSPQLGGNLDTNSQNILIDDAHFIGDENGNEQIIFQTTSSAVNQIDITNAATGSGPTISSTGGDTNINLNLTPKGSGVVMIDGNVGIDTGKIDLKNGGTASQILFYCESSNAHAQTLIAAPHSEGATNTLTLPGTGGDARLVSTASTATLTNKTLTSPKINEDVAVTTTATEINLIDGGTSRGTTALADGDGILINDGGTMRMTNVTTVKTYMAGSAATKGFATAMAIAL
jgi:hypothetical protein